MLINSQIQPPVHPKPQQNPPLQKVSKLLSSTVSDTAMISGHARLANPTQLFSPPQALSVLPFVSSSTAIPRQHSLSDFKAAGTEISKVAEAAGYRRGQVIRDKAVLEAMFAKAGAIYGIPGDFLQRTADRESGVKHWDSADQVKSTAAVGIMQIEKTAYPNEVQGGPANALNNAYDLGNNIALGARNLRQALNRLAQDTGYTGQNLWEDLAPLLNISYNAGPGALKKAMEKARKMGLNPFNWQHLAFGREVNLPAGGKFQISTDWIEKSPLHLALKEIHDSRAARGVHNYPIYWRDKANLKLHDFDQNGVTTRAERLISRVVYTMTGKSLRAR